MNRTRALGSQYLQKPTTTGEPLETPSSSFTLKMKPRLPFGKARFTTTEEPPSTTIKTTTTRKPFPFKKLMKRLKAKATSSSTTQEPEEEDDDEEDTEEETEAETPIKVEIPKAKPTTQVIS